MLLVSKFHVKHAALSPADAARALCRIFPSALNEAERHLSAAESLPRTAAAWVCVSCSAQREGSTWPSQCREGLETPRVGCSRWKPPRRLLLAQPPSCDLRILSAASRCCFFCATLKLFFSTSFAVKSLTQRLDLGTVLASRLGNHLRADLVND